MRNTLALLLLSTFLLLFSTFRISNAENITSILAKYPKFSAFNHYLTTTGLAEQISNHGTVLTICVVDNPTIRRFLTKFRPSTNTLRHILSLHVLQSYLDSRILRHLSNSKDQSLTLFGDINRLVFGYPKYVHITDLHAGKLVEFSVKDENNKETKKAYLISDVKSIPYNISVVQISGILAKPRATPEFHDILSTVMNLFFETFWEKLSGTLAEKIYRENVNSGLTIFCPRDDPFIKFLPRFEKLSKKDKNSLLLFHAMPVYMSFYKMREANGKYETLASDKHNRYALVLEKDDYELKLLKTKVMETAMAGTLLDDQPMAIYSINDVLLPQELFKA